MIYKKLSFQFISVFNFFLNIYILFILFFLGNLEISGEGFVTISLINVFSYGFSGNLRNIYLGNKNNINIKKFLLFRVKIGLIGIICSAILVFFFISKDNILFLISLMSLTIINWIIEIFIARNEKNNKLNFYHILNILFLLVIYPILVFFNFFEYSIYLIIIYILSNLLIYARPLKNIIKLRSIYLKNEKQNFKLGISSTFLKAISNLIWRYSALLIIGKSQSAILFFGFSIGSFYGTLFDISYGALFLKNFKRHKKILLNILYVSYVIFICIFLLIFIKFSTLNHFELRMLCITSILSLLGAYAMIFALDLRQSLFEIKNMQNICFKVDIFLYFFNAALIPLLSIIKLDFIVSAYLISSILFYLVYKVTNINALQRKLQK